LNPSSKPIPSSDTDAPFPGYNVNALIFQSPSMTRSQSSNRTEDIQKDFVMVERRRPSSVKWIDPGPGVPETGLVLQTSVHRGSSVTQHQGLLELPCPWNESSLVSLSSLSPLNKEGEIQILALWSTSIRTFSSLRDPQSDGDWEEYCHLHLLVLDIYQRAFDLCRSWGAPWISTQPSLKSLVLWIHGQFRETLKGLEDGLLRVKREGLGRNVFEVLVHLLHEVCICAERADLTTNDHTYIYRAWILLDTKKAIKDPHKPFSY
jgi:hypothetical protein